MNRVVLHYKYIYGYVYNSTALLQELLSELKSGSEHKEQAVAENIGYSDQTQIWWDAQGKKH